MQISDNILGAQYPNAGRNIQQEALRIKFKNIVTRHFQEIHQGFNFTILGFDWYFSNEKLLEE